MSLAVEAMNHIHWRKPFLAMSVVLALAGGAGCDAEVVSEPSGCATSDDCPEDQVCYGSAACDAVWMCQSEYPCSAVAPFPGCSCGGTVMDFASGCPERHAYSIDTFGGMMIAGGEDFTGFGAPCDPARKPPFRVTVAVSGAGLEDVEGSVFWLRLPSGATPVWAPAGGLPVASGALSFLSSEIDHEAGQSYYAYALIDKNGDGLCEPAEDLAFVPAPVLDLMDFTVRFDITPASFEGASQSYCDSWL